MVVVGAAGLVLMILTQRRLLQLDREAPSSLTLLPGLLWGFLNGFVVGGGPYTRLAYWAWYLLPLSVVAVGSPAIGAVIWGAYSVARVGGAVASAARIRWRGSVRVATSEQYKWIARFAYVGGLLFGLVFLGLGVVNLLPR